jgi:predicted RNA-binding protein with PUA-like domain
LVGLILAQTPSLSTEPCIKGTRSRVKIFKNRALKHPENLLKNSPMQYWLMKSEPDVFSIDDLAKKKTSWWDGVRNYQARNFMMKDMKIGDVVLFYHSNAEPPGIAGLAKVSSAAKPDLTALDKKSEYYDKSATRENPRWFCVEVEFAKKFKNLVPLDQLRTTQGLENMLVIKRGQRLSIQPVTKAEYAIISKLGG